MYRAIAGPAYLGAKVVENGPAWRVLDDELEQLHRRIGQASSGFDEEDSEVIRVRGEVPEDGPIPSLFARGPEDLLDSRDASVGRIGGLPWGSRTGRRK